MLDTHTKTILVSLGVALKREIGEGPGKDGRPSGKSTKLEIVRLFKFVNVRTGEIGEFGCGAQEEELRGAWEALSPIPEV